MKILYYLFWGLLTAFIANACQPVSIKKVDVLVIGGATSGTAAGIQAARMGVNTLIVEETPWLGGMLTAAGVSGVDGNHHLPSGIWNEFRESLRKRYGGAGALQTGWVSATLFEPHVGDSIFKALAEKEKNLEIIYGYYLVSVQKDGDRVTGATFRNSEGAQLWVKAGITIDATDLGDGLAMAGAGYHLGMDAQAETGEDIALPEANNVVQDLTWVAVLKDYGEEADMTIEKPNDYDAELYHGCCVSAEEGINGDCWSMLTYGRLPNNKFMINWPQKGNDIYLNVVEMNREQRIAELQKAKNKTLGFVYYIQTELGFRHLGPADDEFATLDRLAYVPYHREGRRLDGIVRFTYNHVMDPYGQDDKLYRTGISVGDYPVDHHHKCYPAVPGLYFLPVPSFCVPMGALIPEKVEGLIVSDKAISVTNLINGSTRLQPVVLLTGQAAGVLAAMSVIGRQSPREIPIRDIQQKLLDASAYIMPLYDVKPDNPCFQSIQRITATGILKTKGEPYAWANRTWFYPDSCITTDEFIEGLKTCYDPITCEPDNKLLTVGKCIEILSALKTNDLTEKVENDWTNISQRPYQPDVPVTKQELAVLIDRILNPFSMSIDHHGEIRDKS
jgi:hypothetical protein